MPRETCLACKCFGACTEMRRTVLILAVDVLTICRAAGVLRGSHNHEVSSEHRVQLQWVRRGRAKRPRDCALGRRAGAVPPPASCNACSSGSGDWRWTASGGATTRGRRRPRSEAAARAGARAWPRRAVGTCAAGAAGARPQLTPTAGGAAGGFDGARRRAVGRLTTSGGVVVSPLMRFGTRRVAVGMGRACCWSGSECVTGRRRESGSGSER